MSAFMCSPHHINSIASFGTNDPKIIRERTKILTEANIASLVCRYGSRHEKETPQKSTKAPVRDPVVILKLCACFDYQACEVEDYHSTPAARMVDDIRHEAINELAGYAEAPWGI